MVLGDTERMKNKIFVCCIHCIDCVPYECVKAFSTAMHKTALGKVWGKSDHCISETLISEKTAIHTNSRFPCRQTT